MKTEDRTIKKWFEYINNGQIRLPRFQRRSKAWDYGRVEELINSILADLPIGATLVLQVSREKRPFDTRPLEGTPDIPDDCIENLLDGQQRLTAVWKALNDAYKDVTFFVNLEEPKEDEYGTTASRIKCEKRSSWCDNPKEVRARGYAPAKLLCPADIDGRETFTECRDWCKQATGSSEESEKLENKLHKLLNKVKEFNLPMLILEEKTPSGIALDVFIKLNTQAVKLTDFEIFVAQYESKVGESLPDLVEKLRRDCPALDSYRFVENIVLQVFALSGDKAPTTKGYMSLVEELSKEKAKNEWNKISKGIKWAVEFLQEECAFDIKRLPTITIIPVIAAIHQFIESKKLDDLANATDKVRAYIWRSFITDRYGRSPRTHAFQDFRGLRDFFIDKPEKEKREIPVFNTDNEKGYPLPTVEKLISAGWPKGRDPLGKAIMVASLRAGARDIADDQKISSERIGKREYHHLFAYNTLKKAKVPEGDINSALNCVLITMATNRSVSDDDPIEYIRKRIKKANLGADVIRDRLESHIVPFDELNVGDYKKIEESEQNKRIQEDFKNFVQKRAEKMLKVLTSLANGENL